MKLDRFRVKELMAVNRLETQSDLATALGVSRQVLNGWMRGHTLPSRDNLFRLCALLGCTVDEIVIRPLAKERGVKKSLVVAQVT